MIVLFTLLIPLAIAGLLLINTGLVRSRSAAHVMMAGLTVTGIAVLVYCAWGFAIEVYWGGALFLHSLSFPLTAAACFSAFAAALAAIIPLGAGAERWRLGGACASTVILAGGAVPLVAHWAWSGAGPRFIDCGGAGVIQATGGIAALAIAWILGPRRGKFSPEGMPAAIPGHQAVLVLLGCLLAWPGWIGLNAAGSLLFERASADLLPIVAINTTLAAAAAALTSAAITRIRFGKPDASLCANGWISGLVAISAGCVFLAPAAAVIVGAVAGALVTFSVEILELRLGIDDPGGSISVHAIGGIWGLLSAGAFGPAVRWLDQTMAVASLLGLILPVTYGLNLLLNLVLKQRVPPEGERQGMDLHELGAGAYPDFMTHFDDMMQR